MSEFISYNPENKEMFINPEIKLYGEDIDKNMTEYAKLVISFNETLLNKENYSDLKSWQQEIKELDKNRKFQHDAATKEWLVSDFFNGKYNYLEETDESTYIFDKEGKEKKFQFARKMVKKITEKVYMPLLNLKKTEKNYTLSKKDVLMIKKLKEEGIIKYHDEEDIKNINYEKSATDRIIFSLRIDKTIKDYVASNNAFSKLIVRYEPGSDQAKKFIKNADENKTNQHREIVKALIESGFLPPINIQEWLYDKWNDKQSNKLRQIAEKYSEIYLKIINN